jgi:hypothetical protein
MAAEPLPDLERECFFIAPIGSEGTEVRDRSDGIMDYIVTPAAAAFDLVTVRADKIAKPGEMTRQVIEHVVGAKAAVVDLTGANANVYYEMAVRHTAQLPTVLIAQDGEILPFDISQMRTIFFDHTNLKSAARCGEEIKAHLREALDGEVDSPIAASVTVQRLEQGTPQDRVLAQLVDGMDDIRARLRRMPIRGNERVHPAVRDLLDSAVNLAREAAVHGDGDPDLEQAIDRLRRPIHYLGQERYVPDLLDELADRNRAVRELRDAHVDDAADRAEERPEDDDDGPGAERE